MNEDYTELLAELDALHQRLFDLANGVAGNNRGNAAIYLHGAANRINDAMGCLKRGNPNTEPIPHWAILQSMGMGKELG